jgi:5-methylcytosine-specific restriction endonuclease McrA
MEKAERIKQRQWNYLTDYLRANKITYKDYLQSEHWKDVRKRFWKSKLHNGTCYTCGSHRDLQVHHKTYKHIGNEKLNDFVLLCGDCHKETHKIEKKRPAGILYGAAKRLKKLIGRT